MRSRPAVKLPALLILAVNLVLATGAPSHHHERQDAGPILVDAGHHGHGTKLVDPDSRRTSDVVGAALPTLAEHRVYAVMPALTVAPPSTPRPLARGQPPPSDRPRAPPVSV